MDSVLFGMIELTPETLTLMLAWYVIFVISLTFHEAAHALVGWKLGDSTAFIAGQVTLNPLPHIEREPVGTIVVPILSFLMSGYWMMGWASAPYNPYWAIRYPGRAVWMAMAGPAANLLLVLIATGAIGIGFATDFFVLPDNFNYGYDQIVAARQEGLAVGSAKLVSILFSLNLFMFFFNLFPIPPLDGSTLWSLILKHETYLRFQAAMQQPIYRMLGFIVLLSTAPQMFTPVFYWAIDLLYRLA